MALNDLPQVYPLSENLSRVISQIGKDVTQIKHMPPPTINTRKYVLSRGSGLVTNFNGILGDNTNFSDFDYNPHDFPEGCFGSFTTNRLNADLKVDELIALDQEARYQISFYIKTINKTGNNLGYFYMAFCDVDGNAITPSNVSQLNIKLNAQHNAGQTTLTIHPAYKSAFETWYNRNKTTTASLAILQLPYKSTGGYIYDKNEYSRVFCNNLLSLNRFTYNSSTGMLSAPGFRLTRGIPNDTLVGLSLAGGTYTYMMPTLINTPIPDKWTKHSRIFTVKDLMFPSNPNHPTNMIIRNSSLFRIGWLCNRNTPNGSVTGVAGATVRIIG